MKLIFLCYNRQNDNKNYIELMKNVIHINSNCNKTCISSLMRLVLITCTEITKDTLKD